MAYTTAAECKAYMGISVSTDDTLITALIARATAIINEYTGRVFEAETSTKYFTIDDVEGQHLWLFGYDLLTVTTLKNGDASTTAITSGQYVLEPRNQTPKYAIRLKEDYDWEFDDGDSEIEVAGTWGFSATVPADIAHATIRLVSFLYRQKDTSADIDRPLVTGDGITIMPSTVPADVKAILEPYRRRFG